MISISNEAENNPGPTGSEGEQNNTGNSFQENNNPSASEQQGDEQVPDDEESKKEEMTGYNEHPDQEKVGGG